jgi:magnesium transporter
VSWVNIDGLHDHETISKMGKVFNIHSLLLEDIMNTDQRPKTIELDDRYIIIVKILNYDEDIETIGSEQLAFVFSKNYLLTIKEKSGLYFESVRERIRGSKGRIRKLGSDYLCFALLDTIVDNYLILIEAIGDKIEQIDKELFNGNNSDLVERIYKHKMEINFLRKSIRPIKEIIAILLQDDTNLISEENMKYYHDLNDLAIQATEAIEVYHSMLIDQLGIYHTNMSNKSNEIMKVLTIFAAIFIPLTFVAGIYGTNFEYFPELKLRYGYLYFWIVMIVIAMVLLNYFRRKKWL